MIEIKRRQQQAAQMPMERAQKPADGLEGQAMGEYTPSAEPALKREIRPFMGINDERRDYRAMYRAAFEYHDRHNPPMIDREYWQTHTHGIDDTPQAELEYWQCAARDAAETARDFDNDEFIVDLLVAVYNDLERSYKTLKSTSSTPSTDTRIKVS